MHPANARVQAAKIRYSREGTHAARQRSRAGCQDPEFPGRGRIQPANVLGAGRQKPDFPGRVRNSTASVRMQSDSVQNCPEEVCAVRQRPNALCQRPKCPGGGRVRVTRLRIHADSLRNSSAGFASRLAGPHRHWPRTLSTGQARKQFARLAPGLAATSSLARGSRDATTIRRQSPAEPRRRATRA